MTDLKRKSERKTLEKRLEIISKNQGDISLLIKEVFQSQQISIKRLTSDKVNIRLQEIEDFIHYIWGRAGYTADTIELCRKFHTKFPELIGQKETLINIAKYAKALTNEIEKLKLEIQAKEGQNK